MIAMLPHATELARQIRSGERTAADVVEQCLTRIESMDGVINAVAIPLADSARKQAALVDAQVARGTDPGRLAGVPFTMKECYHFEGTCHSLGRQQAAVEAQHTSPIIDRLMTAGAIPIAKCNLSQLMLLYETDNPRYGRTNHPANLERSPGGSGGGDAAALAAGYACFSVGTDMGGSIRHPAHSCGLAGFVPTAGRIETRGVARILPGMTPVALQPGLLARVTSEIVGAFSTWGKRHIKDGCFGASWTPSNRPLNGLRVGYWESDDYFPTCSTIRRAVAEAVERLRDQGVHAQPIAPPSHEEALHLYCAIFGADGGQLIRERLRGERIDDRIKPLLRLGRLPKWMRQLIANGFQWLGDARLAGILRNSYRCSASTLWQLTEAIAVYRNAFLTRMQSMNLDAIVMPAHATVAYKHGASQHMLPAASYAMIANVLGAPAGVVKITSVRDDEQAIKVADKSRSMAAAADNLIGATGLPCGVQVMGAPWDDAVVLQLMDALESTSPVNISTATNAITDTVRMVRSRSHQ